MDSMDKRMIIAGSSANRFQDIVSEFSEMIVGASALDLPWGADFIFLFDNRCKRV